MDYQFTPRNQLSDYEFDFKKENWVRPKLDIVTDIGTGYFLEETAEIILADKGLHCQI